jgi:beta-mannosidase
MNQTKDEYRKLYVDIVMSAVKMIDTGTNRPFITSSPSNGVESIEEDYIAKNPQDPHYGMPIHICLKLEDCLDSC